MAADSYLQYLADHGEDIDPQDIHTYYRSYSFYLPPEAPKFKCKRCNLKIFIQDASQEPDLCKPCELVKVKPVAQVRSLRNRSEKAIRKLRCEVYDLKQHLNMLHPYTSQYVELNAQLTSLLSLLNQ